MGTARRKRGAGKVARDVRTAASHRERRERIDSAT